MKTIGVLLLGFFLLFVIAFIASNAPPKTFDEGVQRCAEDRAFQGRGSLNDEYELLGRKLWVVACMKRNGYDTLPSAR